FKLNRHRSTLTALSSALPMELFEVWLHHSDSSGGSGAPASCPTHVSLPVQPNKIIGRERDIAEACDELLRPDCHLLTLLGLGGIGKTRISLALAEAVADHFDGGVYFLDLNQPQDPGAVPTLLLAQLGLSVAESTR